MKTKNTAARVAQNNPPQKPRGQAGLPQIPGYAPGEIGQAIIKMVKKAIAIIRRESHNLKFEDKIGYSGMLDDVVTSGDKLAQLMYLREIRKMQKAKQADETLRLKAEQPLNQFGILAEEDYLTVPCTFADADIYFTLDPLDGTKAYKRKQSHGVGTMIALVMNGEVIAAYIGDINTGEIYGFDATIDPAGAAWRTRFGKTALLTPELDLPLRKQYVALRRHPEKEAKLVQRMFRPLNQKGLFKDIEAGGGSIGTSFARLWKGEIGAMVLDQGHRTPWDEAPVVGISQRLGFVFIDVIVDKGDAQGEVQNETRGDDRGDKNTPEATRLEQRTVKLVKEVTTSPVAQIVIHKTHLAELEDWIKNAV